MAFSLGFQFMDKQGLPIALPSLENILEVSAIRAPTAWHLLALPRITVVLFLELLGFKFGIYICRWLLMSQIRCWDR